MPDADGLAIAAQLQNFAEALQVVFVTAHPQHALAAYQVAPADYLLKPVSAERLTLTLTRLKMKLKAEPLKSSTKWLTYRTGLTTRRVTLNDLFYFQAEDKYVRMVFAQGEALIEQSLKQLEEQFPQELTRIHRNTLVSTDKIKALHQSSDGRHFLELQNLPTRLEISRRELTKLRQLLIVGK
jgi:two-component system response regulator AlgR